MERMQVGVVGVGHMGQYHVGVYSEMHQVELAGLADIREERASEIAGRYGTVGYTDYRDLIGKVQAVSIAVPTAQHFAIGKDFLQAGVHVLLEKPMVSSIAEGEELLELAARHDVVLHSGHVERFNGAVQELMKIVKEPLLIESRRLGPYVVRDPQDGVVLDLMIHDLDIILSLVDSPVREMRAVGTPVLSSLEDLATVQIWFSSGCLATLTASRVTQHKIRTMAVTQRDSYVFLNYTDQDIHIHRQASSHHTLTREELRYATGSFVERVFVHKENPLKQELRHFIECARNGNDPQGLQSELYSLKVALEIQEMLQKGL